MFVIYLNTLHSHHEKGLALGKRSSDAYLAILSNIVDGQFRMAMAMLHPVMSGANSTQLIAHSEYLPNAEHHQQLAIQCLAECKEKLDEFNNTLLAIVEHHTSGWSMVSNELLTKLQTDAVPELKAWLNLAKTTVAQAAAAESSTISAIQRAATVDQKVGAQNRRRSPTNSAKAIE